MAEAWICVPMATDIGLGLAAGFTLAHGHLAALAANVRLYLTPGPAWRPIGLHVVRFAVVVLSFAIAARFGAPALIAMLAGFTLGRALVLRRYR
jgi:hypothetical protein